MPVGRHVGRKSFEMLIIVQILKIAFCVFAIDLRWALN